MIYRNVADIVNHGVMYEIVASLYCTPMMTKSLYVQKKSEESKNTISLSHPSGF